MEIRAWVWYQQGRLKDAKREASQALEVYQKAGAAKDMGDCGDLLREIAQAMKTQSTNSQQ